MQIRPMNQADAKGGLSCGKPALDVYFSKRAWDHHQKGIAKVFVLEDLAAPGVILGSYSLSASSWERDRLQGALPSSLPKNPMPLFYIGYFAVTKARQGQGLGKRLMADALRRCLDAAESIGAMGVGLDSLSEDSTRFYAQLGFVEVPAEPTRPADDTRQPMFIPMSTLLASKPNGP
jgi:GNAT superfamily N-acetyltransferase